MKKISILFCCILWTFCFSQNIDGVWFNKELRSSILEGSLKSKSFEIMKPMFFKISKGKIANYYQVEPTVDPEYKLLKKIGKDTYTNGSASYILININTILYKTKTKEITFIRNQNTNLNDLFDTKTLLTKRYINFSKLSSIKNIKLNKESDIKCAFDGRRVNCSNNVMKFSYIIYSSNPYYHDSWNDLEFYIDINIDNFKKTYLIEKNMNHSYDLKDLNTNKIEYILKY